MRLAPQNCSCLFASACVCPSRKNSITSRAYGSPPVVCGLDAERGTRGNSSVEGRLICLHVTCRFIKQPNLFINYWRIKYCDPLVAYSSFQYRVVLCFACKLSVPGDFFLFSSSAHSAKFSLRYFVTKSTLMAIYLFTDRDGEALLHANCIPGCVGDEVSTK